MPGPKGVDLRVSWFYRPEETPHGRKPWHSEHELFASDHTDPAQIKSILRRCRVLELRAFQALPERDEDDFFWRFTWKAVRQVFDPPKVPVFCICAMPYNPDVPMLECAACAEWYHPACVGMAGAPAGGAARDAFRCPECVAAAPS